MKQLLIIASVFMLAGCIVEDEDSEPTLLEGTWKSPCEDYSEDGTVYGQSIVTFTGSNITSINRTYDSTSCEGDTYTSVQTAKSTLTIGDQVTLASGQTATKVTYEFTELSIRYNLQSEVTDFNTTAECNYTDWVVGVEKDILSCNLGTDTIALDIVLIEDDKLYFGDYVESGYPTSLDAAVHTRL